MLIWLTNANNGYNPNIPPNENFGREVMQLYTIGLFQLNSDGTEVMDPNNPGQPLVHLHRARREERRAGAHRIPTAPANPKRHLSGLGRQRQLRIATRTLPATNGGFNVMGQTVPDPGGAQCAWSYSGAERTVRSDNFVAVSGEQSHDVGVRIQRTAPALRDENPSAGLRPAHLDRLGPNGERSAADRESRRRRSSADPEFMTGKYTMIKEPVEFEIDAIRALGGATSESGDRDGCPTRSATRSTTRRHVSRTVGPAVGLLVLLSRR